MQCLGASPSTPSTTTSACPSNGTRHTRGHSCGYWRSLSAWRFASQPMPAQSAGVRFFVILPDTKGRPLTGAAWYPCSAPEEETTVRNRAIQGTRDCLLVGDKLPLVV